jgi:hypothetical protein
MKIAAIVITGALLGALLHYLYVHSVIVLPYWADSPWPSFFVGSLLTLAKVAPGFLVGWAARRSGFLFGAITGVLAELMHQAVSVGHYPLAQLLLMTLPPALISCVAGAAGELARLRRPPSNNSFKPKPLRGSA